MYRFIIVLMLGLALLPPSAQAHGGAGYRQDVQVGPYPVVIEFSEWPIRAERSVDYFFEPAGGVDGKTATITFISPKQVETALTGHTDPSEHLAAWPLPRHPRQRDVWGLDLFALPHPGEWQIKLTIDGPLGPGEATVGPFTVLEQPGPPAPVSWAVGVLPPLGFLVWLIARAGLRVHPGRRAEARVWR